MIDLSQETETLPRRLAAA